MFLKNIFSEDFILNIMTIPGSSDDVCKKTIEYYKEQLQNQNLSDTQKDIAKAFVQNLTNYYLASNLENTSLRNNLPHLSESARFIESKRSENMDIESSGRIKSFYSIYQKLIDNMYEYIANDKSIINKDFVFDIYATRDIFYPRHDMKTNPEAFYKHTYKTIFEYMEYIDDLSRKDPRYGFAEQSEKTLRDLEKPKINIYEKNSISIPKKDFVEYLLESKNIPNCFRYLTNLSNYMTTPEIEDLILDLKQSNLDIADLSKLKIYNYIEYQTKQEEQCDIRNYFEAIFLKKLETIINNNPNKDVSKHILKDYYALPTQDFIKNYRLYFSKYDLDCCNFINYISKYINSNEILDPTTLPKFQSREFESGLSIYLTDVKYIELDSIQKKLQELKNINLDSFEQKFADASKITYYSRFFKDYMKNPKGNGYQSLHIIVNTPFGPYEKQFRTAAQNEHAEFGSASHSKVYKPKEKEQFHRLNVPKYLSPKRDTNGDIIVPIELGVLPFEQCVHNFYGEPFKTFAHDKTFEELKSECATKEEFDQKIFDLSPVTKEHVFIKTLISKFSRKKPQDTIYDMSATTTEMESETIPNDIAVYPQNNTKNDVFSTDDTDPHDSK